MDMVNIVDITPKLGHKDKIILLDLNYTLAQSISMDRNFRYDVSQDVYRLDLVNLIRNNRIFLITARTDNYKDVTISKIRQDTGMDFERYYFKPMSQKFVPAHTYKKSVAIELLKEFGKPACFFGIESNKQTRQEYSSLNIESMPYSDFIKFHQNGIF